MKSKRNFSRAVDPDFFDVGVIEIRLKRSIAGHQVQNVFTHGGKVNNAGQASTSRTQVVIFDGGVDNTARGFYLVQRVQSASADLLPDVRLDQPNSVFSYHCGHNSPWGSPEPN